LAQHDIDALIALDDAEAVYQDEASANAFFARAILGCAAATPALMHVINVALQDGDPRVRAGAADAAVALVRTERLSIHRTEIETKILAMARSAENPDERSAHVLALGELGHAPLAFLTDSSPAVRVCAAMAPALATNPAAIDELVDAFNHHVASIDGWFADRPPQFLTRPRFYLVRCAVERVNDFAQLAAGALTVAGITWSSCVDVEWGPLLVAAFPDGDGLVRTPEQLRFLAALVAKPELWKSGNLPAWLRRAGLPADREGCAQRLESAQP
jgi:hypothetical protein